jgi:hypothetical protein
MRFEPSIPLALLLASFGPSLAACGGGGDEVKPDLKPIVGLLELPISHRAGGSEPADPTRVEIGVSEIRIDGETALPLENGKVPAAERQGDQLPKLKSKLGQKRALSISVHAATPYETLERVLSTAFSAGAKEVGFKVRKPNSNTESGFLNIKDNRIVDSAEDSKFAEAELLPWDTFVAAWDTSLEACQATQRGDCGYAPLAKAQGGKLDMMLRSRGIGLAVRFRQTGVVAPPPEEKKPAPRAEMLDGIAAQPTAEEKPPEPSTEHVFTLRADQATVTPSPISGIVKPVCSGQSCATVVDAEGPTMSGRVISLIGAAFPDGTPEPKVAWVKAPS